MKPKIVALLLAGTASLMASSAAAQEIQLTGPLKGAAAVRGLRLYREGRVEIAPSAGFTLLDEYRRSIFVGARVQYNIKDWLGVGVWGGYGLGSFATDLTDKIDATTPRNVQTASQVSPAKGGFAEQTGRLQWVAAPQITFVPFRGKLALFQKLFTDTDMYASLGVAFVGTKERGACGAAGQVSCTDPNSFALASRVAIAPTLGVGFNFYFAKFMAFNLEYRALPFSWNRAGFDQRGAGNDGKFPDTKIDGEDRTFKWNQMITLGFGISLPSKPTVSE